MSSNAVKFIDDNKQEFINQLIDLAKIPSCSWEGFDPKFVIESAHKTKELMLKAGFENIEIITISDSHPYIYADWLHAGADKPTVLLYAHHDIQPPMREELWKTPPHTPTEINGRLFGRGTADDKAGILIHLASLTAYLKTEGKCPVNLKVIIEGEEEIGSPHLQDFVKKYSGKLKADTMILTDLSNFDTGVPALTTSLRGLVSMQLNIKTMERPVHSGMFGGPIPDPSVAMSKIIAGLTNHDGTINIPELYTDIIYLTDDEKREIAKLPMDDDLFKEQINMEKHAHIIGGNGHVLEKVWRLPSFSINSIESGSKKLAGNVIMDSCWAKIGLRLAPGMDAKKVRDTLIKKIKELTPWGLECHIEMDTCNSGWNTSSSHPYFKAAMNALTEGYGKQAVMVGCGGSIPFVAPFSEYLGNIPALLVGVEDPYCNAHSENESLDLSDFHKAMRSQVLMFSALANIK